MAQTPQLVSRDWVATMADLRLLRATGTRTYINSLIQAPEGAPKWLAPVFTGWFFATPVDRAGLGGGPWVEAEYLPGTGDPKPYGSRMVDRPELLSAVVGLQATSRDRRRGLHLREITTNQEWH